MSIAMLLMYAIDVYYCEPARCLCYIFILYLILVERYVDLCLLIYKSCYMFYTMYTCYTHCTDEETAAYKFSLYTIFNIYVITIRH